MNILMLTSVYPQPDDGDFKTTATVEYFCKEWSRQGHRVIVIHNGSKFPTPIYYIPNQIRSFLEKEMQIQFPRHASRHDIYREENDVKIYRKNMFKYKPHGSYSDEDIQKQGEKIISIIDSENFIPDVIIGHWANPQVPLLSWLKRNYKGNYRTAIVFHNDCYEADVRRYLLNKFIRDIDAIGCRNKMFGEIIKKNLNLSKQPFLCYSGIPNQIVKDTDIQRIISEKESNTIIYVGRLVKYKKVDAIIDGLAKTKNTLHLEIVGEGSDKQIVIENINKYGLMDRINIIDQLKRDEVFRKMASKECFTMISENEVFGMVYLEAMLMGCITIASRGCALDGIIEDGVNGFLCEAGNPDELASIYDRIATLSTYEKQEIMINAYETAKMYSDENVAEKYLIDIQTWNNF